MLVFSSHLCHRSQANTDLLPLSSEGSNPEDLQALGQPEAILGLRPLAVWMSNSLELLQFIQCQLPLILKWRTRKEKGQEVEEGGMENDQNKGRENLG